MPRTGRPTFQPTAAQRRKVEQLVSCGMSEDDIARVISCSTPTLTKYFGEELATGRAKKRAEVIDLLWKQARKGNVSATKKLEDMTGIAATKRAEPRAPAPRAPGKKEQAQQDAQNPDPTSPMGDLIAKRQAMTKH